MTPYGVRRRARQPPSGEEAGALAGSLARLSSLLQALLQAIPATKSPALPPLLVYFLVISKSMVKRG